MVDADWHAFCQALYKGIEGRLGRNVRGLQRIEQGCGVVKKPQEAQKAKALWAMSAVKERKKEFNDPARKDNI